MDRKLFAFCALFLALGFMLSPATVLFSQAQQVSRAF